MRPFRFGVNGISAKRLLPVVRKARVRRLGAQLSARRGRCQSHVAETAADLPTLDSGARRAPGHRLGREGDRNIFCAVLAWSRYRFVRLGADQTRTPKPGT